MSISNYDWHTYSVDGFPYDVAVREFAAIAGEYVFLAIVKGDPLHRGYRMTHGEAVNDLLKVLRDKEREPVR